MAAAREEREGMGVGTGEGLEFPPGRLEEATREGQDVRGDSTTGKTTSQVDYGPL
jgi:hypothetical protein